MNDISQILGLNTEAQIWNLTPKASQAWYTLGKAVMNSASELTAAEKELIAVYSVSLRSKPSLRNNKGYAWRYNAPETLQQLLDDPASADVPGNLLPILSFVKKLSTEAFKLMQSDVDPIFAAGWSERTLTDVVMICSLVSFHWAVVAGHGTANSGNEFSFHF